MHQEKGIKVMKTILIIINRLIGLPLFMIMGLVGVIILWFKYVINFIIYGGEAISYTKKLKGKLLVMYSRKYRN